MTQPLELPTPNLPLLRKVLDHIDAHPEEWDQEVYGTLTDASPCGTAFCVAGHALNMVGRFTLGNHPNGGTMMLDGRAALGAEVGDAAADLLGLTEAERRALFSMFNSRESVQYAAERIAERAGEVL
jgi:hypothetical protein